MLARNIALFFLLFTFSGCEPKYQFASLDENLSFKSSEERSLSKRHLAYWELMSQKKFTETYDFELPYQRYIYGEEWYHKFFEGNNKEYKIIFKALEWLDEHSAVVHTEYIRQKNRHTFKDKWFYVNGKWYHMFPTSKLPKAEE